MIKRKMLLFALGISAIGAFIGCKTSATEEASNRNTIYLTGEFPSAEELAGEDSEAIVSVLLNDKADIDLEELYNSTDDEMIKQAIDYARGKEKETLFLRLLLEDGEISENDLANLMNPDTVEFSTTIKEESYIYDLGLMVSMQRTPRGLSNMETDEGLADQAKKIIESGRYNAADNIFVLKNTEWPISCINDIDTMIAENTDAVNFLFKENYNKIGCCTYTKKMGNRCVEQYIVIVLGTGDIKTFEEFEFTDELGGDVAIETPLVEPTPTEKSQKKVIIEGVEMTEDEAGLKDEEEPGSSIIEGAGVESEISTETVVAVEKTGVEVENLTDVESKAEGVADEE